MGCLWAVSRLCVEVKAKSWNKPAVSRTVPVVVVGLLQALASKTKHAQRKKKPSKLVKAKLYRALLECTVDCAAAAAVACVGWYVVSGS